MRFERQVASRLYAKGVISKEVANELISPPPADGPALDEAPQGSVRERLARQRLVSDAQWVEAVAETVGLKVFSHLALDKIQIEYTKALKVSYAKENRILPLWEEGGRLLVGVSDPLNMGPMSAFARLFSLPLEPVYVPEQVLIDVVNKVFDRRAAAAQVIDEIDQDQVVSADAGINDIDIDIIDADDEAPIIRLVNAILSQAIKERASDIHIEPFERYISVRFRVDGVLNEVIQPPKRFHASVSSRIKIMAGLDIAEKRIPQDGRIKLKVAGKEIDIRLSTLPTSFGERLVMRILDKTAVLKDLGHIGMGSQALAGMNELITRSYGIILVTGPTGSGKTTTLYASLAKINSPIRNIITVEDPVEYQLPGIGQTQVNDRVGLTFAAGLRSILRQDPDVVMIGEIRDRETAEIAIQASLTGHLVFSTLHTNDSAGAVTRLVDMGIEPFLISSSVIGMMAQRLVRTLCPACKEPVVPTDVELQQINYTRERFLAESQGYVYQARGCHECMGNGYRGRTGIYELLHVDDEIRGLIMANVDSNTIKKRAIIKGMMTLRDDGTRKVFAGDTSISEILRVTQDDLLSFD